MAGCEPVPTDNSHRTERLQAYSHAAAPQGAPPGSCWGLDHTPAVIETVTEQILVSPEILAEDGSVESAARYRTETRQEIIQPRQELRFETPCFPELSVEFLETLQRALIARGYYDGAITAQLDPKTERAIRAFQQSFGLDSRILSLDAARRLGLSAIDLSQF
nr:peptidoglycan-binding protein [Cochlodiniinecator piscidefendens]